MRRSIFAGLLATLLLLSLYQPAISTATTECSDEVMNACETMWSTAMSECLAGGSSLSVCWTFANKKHSDCLRVNQCYID